MDVGNPSNFVRMKRFFEDDWKLVTEKISGYFFTDRETQESMREVFGNTNYVHVSAYRNSVSRSYRNIEKILIKISPVFFFQQPILPNLLIL